VTQHKGICSTSNTASRLGFSHSGGLYFRVICPSICLSDWDKRKTSAVSCYAKATYDGRNCSKRRGQDSLESCLLPIPDRSNTLLNNALRRYTSQPHSIRLAYLGKAWRYKNATRSRCPTQTAGFLSGHTWILPLSPRKRHTNYKPQGAFPSYWRFPEADSNGYPWPIMFYAAFCRLSSNFRPTHSYAIPQFLRRVCGGRNKPNR